MYGMTEHVLRLLAILPQLIARARIDLEKLGQPCMICFPFSPIPVCYQFWLPTDLQGQAPRPPCPCTHQQKRLQLQVHSQPLQCGQTGSSLIVLGMTAAYMYPVCLLLSTCLPR